MGLLASNRPRIIAALGLSVLIALLARLFQAPEAPLGDSLLESSYDTLHIFGPQNNLGSSPVVIVYLDLPSYIDLRQDPKLAWPRELHAALLHRLTSAGARAVVFDVVFEGASNPAADQALAEAIRQNGRVFLAAEYNNKATDQKSEQQLWTRLSTVRPPFALLADAAAGWGIAALRIDDDFAVRQFLAGFKETPALSWAAASFLRLPLTQARSAVQNANQHWIRYYGPPLTIPHVSYSHALDPASISDDFFRNKIVFVGSRSVVGLFRTRQDEFRNPFHASWYRTERRTGESGEYNELFLPGVEVHATEMLNVVRGDWLRRLSDTQEAALLLLAAVLCGGGLIWLRPLPATAAALAGAAITLGAAVFAFSRGTWFPWVIVAGLQIPVGLGGSIVFSSLEWLLTRRRLEAARREAEAKVREQAALIDKAHDAILVQTISGGILYANPSAERLYGWDLPTLQSDGRAAELFAPDAPTVAIAREAALSRGEWTGELRLQTRTGQIITVDSRWTLIRDESSRPKALLMINSDITEKKNLEAQFLRTQRMNTIGTLAGGMAHDLNNALAPILMGVQLLRRKTNDDEACQLLKLVETNTHRSADMVRQVLLFARGRGGEFQSLLLGPLLVEVEKMVKETFPKNISVDTFVAADLWPVHGNSTQLHQVLLNLCVNARDAMPQGGQLSFAADNVELNAAEAATIPQGSPGQFVSLLVSDTGAGMTPDVLSRIFEPFFTTKAEGRGTGIGLATVLRIVRNHEGFLRVESEPGKGTTFEVFLPRAGISAPAPNPAPASAQPRGQGELILVADDEQAIRDLLADGLQAQGYRVLTAANGEEACQLFGERQSEVRLLLVDNAMPVVDGPEAVRRIRQLRPELPMILASGEAPAEEQVQNGLQQLQKPFSLEEVLAAVGRALGKTG